ncbi:MAG: tripartite tricarboxylate transporter TctB family protein [Roseovarius sp.]
MKTVHKRDFVLGLAVCALALIILFGILPWAVKAPKVIPNLALSPTFWPRIILVSLAGLSALLAIRAYVDHLRAGQAGGEAGGTGGDPLEDTPPFDLSDLRVIVAALLMVGFCALLKPYGVVLPAMALLAAMILLHDRKHWPGAIVLTIATVAALYLFFRFVARVPVPLGPLNAIF